MIRNISVALLLTLTVALTLGVTGPLASSAQAAGIERVGDAGEVYAWTAGC